MSQISDRVEVAPSVMEQVRAIVRAHPAAKAQLALLGDKHFLFNAAGSAFVMYGVQGRSWVALGDPVGPAQQLPGLIRQFHDVCVARGMRPVFHEISQASLPICQDLGLRTWRVAEEGRVRLDTFSLAGRNRKRLRNAVRKAEKQGCTFAWFPSTVTTAGLLAQLQAVSDAWLHAKPTREKRFSLGCFDSDYVSNFSAGLVEHNKRPIAFVTVWAGTQHHELYLDLMRYIPGAPRGTMDLLFAQVLQRARQDGYVWFNVGMSPLPPPGGPARGLRGRARACAQRFYNLDGLRQYKEKFHPKWSSRYFAAPPGVGFIRALVDVATLTSGGLRGVVAK